MSIASILLVASMAAVAGPGEGSSTVTSAVTPVRSNDAAGAVPVVKVLLMRTRQEVSLPQPGRLYRVTGGRQQVELRGPLTIRRSAPVTWQAGAWRDPARAALLAGKLSKALTGKADVAQVVESGSELTRIRVTWRSSSVPASPGAALARLGFSGAFPVGGGRAVEVRSAQGATIIDKMEVQVQPLQEWPIAIGERSYHGSLRARVSGPDLLVINRLDMETYLRGVLPVEMGPLVFPELEALKAQAVAARTYAVAHLGDHQDEGYDLCDSPACQAYHGVTVHHSLTDRAVAETAGLIATYGGVPIDAMYTSTCGGRTDPAALIFPDRAQPYLQGTVCAWERPLQLLGSSADGPWQERSEVAEELALAALSLAREQARPEQVIKTVAQVCSGHDPAVHRDADAATFATALLVAAGLGEAAATLPGPGAPVPALLRLSDLLEIELRPPASSWDHGWHLQAALAALELQGVVQRDSGEAVPRPEGVGIYPRRADRSELLPTPLPLFEGWQTSWRRLAQISILPGTHIERVRKGDRILALVVKRSSGNGVADRRSAWRSWSRERTWSELGQRLGMHDLQDLRVTARSPGGRVIGLTAVAHSGRSRQWHGFAVRQALDLPECLFTMHRMRRNGVDVVRFLGRGWGHGIGLCQNGAYGLARAGKTFDEILKTYYKGVEIVEWPGESP
jgi:stage II sporulation protein D